jgi:hypothetical protein
MTAGEGDEKQNHEAHRTQIPTAALGFLCEAAAPGKVFGLILVIFLSKNNRSWVCQGFLQLITLRCLFP